MKVKCPKCRKVVQAPDEWAGKKVKCPGCKKRIILPVSDDGRLPDDLDFDLGSLRSMELGGQPVVHEGKRKPLSLKEAQEQAAAARAEKPDEAEADPSIRVCPKCGQKVKSPDPYCEVMCRHCGTGIPGVSLGNGRKVKYQDSMADRMKAPTTFYSGFTTAATYPLPAMGSIISGMAVAFGTIVVPLLGMLGFIASSGLNPITQPEGGTDYGWVGIFITVAFAIQSVYFGSVGYYILIDTIRTTTSGTEQPPNLTWNIINLGVALGGYGALIGLYLVVVVLLVTVSKGFPTQMSDFAELSRPGNLIVLTLITFIVPMNMIGLSSSHPLDGLNPIRIGKSILGTHGHYVFLFLITLLYLGIYVGIMAAVLTWAGPAIMSAATEGLGVGLLSMLGGLAGWAVVIGAGFYFTYSIGRILGLFCRTYRENLDFEL